MSEPQSIRSNNGLLDTTITLTKAVHEPVAGVAINTFSLNSTIPGPTLRLKPGDKMRILFKNELPAQPNGQAEHNKYGYVDQSNLHWHGFHVSGELPSDDVLLSVGPDESFQYETDLPSYHMPGTHWMHPHRHGSSAAQVGGGAASALIIEDPPNSLPEQVEGAKELLFFIQHHKLEELTTIAERSRDEQVWQAPASGPENKDEYFMVNGNYNPVFSVLPGEWVRWRMVYAGWFGGSIDIQISNGCEMKLLAKDGVYIADFPRSISMVPLVPGARSDVMIRCIDSSSTAQVTSRGEVIARVTTSSSDTAVNSTALGGWDTVTGGLVYPEYLASVMDAPVSEGCSCTTKFSGDGIDGVLFDESNVLHTSYLGATVERLIDARDHPYHQHLYPFQLVSGISETEYFKLGDWHDTYMPEQATLVRYKAVGISGKLMLHCHRLDHEDRGMMGIEMVSPAGSTCTCTNPSSLSPAAIGGIVAAALVTISLAILFRKRTSKSTSPV